MYAAKRSGRDCVRLESDLEAETPPQDEPESVRIAQALAFAASVREGMPALHCQQVADLAAATAEELGLRDDTVLRCRLGGWVHDVGKVAIPDAVLRKPGPLDDEEWDVVRSHVEVGEAIVARVPALRGVGAAVRHHHERWDGTGYPDGLAAEEIPIEARVVAAADAYSAMAADRPYSGERERDDAIAELRSAAGSQLDAAVVEALVGALERADAAFEASMASRW
jgi:HD-GYP domain-containing protein (c-di-GMP phosphodiesterase class II)